MADSYIDYLECLEYGDALIAELPKLASASKLVNVDALQAHVLGAMKDVAAELEKQGVKRSSVRVDRKDVDAQAKALRKTIEKFYHYVNSLDEEVSFDAHAFFAGGNQGSLSHLKPADLAQKAGEVLRGFSAAANKNLPDAAKWAERIENSQSALAAALTGKASSTGQTIKGTAALVAAREAFLVAYNGVAKRLVMAILIELGRKDELKLFFKDLQVNEDRPTKEDAADAPEATPTVT